MKFDLGFVLKDCQGDLVKVQRRIDRHCAQIRNEALEEAAKRAEKFVDANIVGDSVALIFDDLAKELRCLALAAQTNSEGVDT